MKDIIKSFDEAVKSIKAPLLISLGLVLMYSVACAPATNDQGQVIPDLDSTPHIVQDFFLDDGTRCVFTKSSSAGGLSCDFDANRRRAE